ncbi:MAG: Na+ dependent nucleoside transporter [Tannerella sp.]|jgi:CNT family concentrative nucleoside transporter|nr:Na+ dependent nucleoside transporter [Tannerella sp.]
MIESTGFSGMSLLRGLLGIIALLGIAYLCSSNRKRIDWKLVTYGLILQIALALSVLYVPFVGIFFEFIGRIFVKIVDFSQAGVAFLLGPYAAKNGAVIFLIHSLPSIILFSALVSLFYYWGVIQRIIGAFSWALKRLFRSISGAEGLVVAGNVFLGMTEAPILARIYLPRMNKSELFLVMVSGMGTIAGTVMGAYIGILGGNDAAAQIVFAKYLLTASVMAAPGSIVLAKMFCPQTETTDSASLHYSDMKSEHHGFMEALASGTMTGVKLMVNIAAMLLVFIALVAILNYISKDIIGQYTGLNEWVASVTSNRSDGFTIQFILGAILSPFSWLIGVPGPDMMAVGSLLGQKTVLNEFVAYVQLQEWKTAGIFLYEKSVVMSTYLLCGFANFGSVGMLIGGLGVLAPEKRPMVASLGIRAMIAGALTSALSATMIGMISG